MRVLVIGGHFSPALAVMEELKKSDEVIYAGRKYSLEGDKALSLEYQTVPEMGIQFEEINPGRIQRRPTFHSLFSLTRVPKGYARALEIVKKVKPDVIMGFGGYVLPPFTLASLITKTPLVIHEQTFGAGWSNRFSGFFAKFICISHKTSEKYFPQNKIILTGNPVRKEIFSTDNLIEQPKGKDPLIYITGGSQGSHFINMLVEKNLDSLVENYRLVHQTGDSKQFMDYDRLRDKRESLGKKKEKYLAYKFLTPPQAAIVMKNADLIISRGGANTVWEIFLLSKPALIIPLKISKGDQMLNANFLKDSGLGMTYDEKSSFIDQVNDIMNNISKYKRRASEEIPSDPTLKIIEVLRDVVKINKKEKEENTV